MQVRLVTDEEVFNADFTPTKPKIEKEIGKDAPSRIYTETSIVHAIVLAAIVYPLLWLFLAF
jgi:hypothetical protein